MRMRKKKNLEARMEVCAALWVKDPVQMRGAWREKMPGARLLRLELGCGKGRFTAGLAADGVCNSAQQSAQGAVFSHQ